MDDEQYQEQTGTDYAMVEVQNTSHDHAWEYSGTDHQGWFVWKCACGAGKAIPGS